MNLIYEDSFCLYLLEGQFVTKKKAHAPARDVPTSDALARDAPTSDALARDAPTSDALNRDAANIDASACETLHQVPAPQLLVMLL